MRNRGTLTALHRALGAGEDHRKINARTDLHRGICTAVPLACDEFLSEIAAAITALAIEPARVSLLRRKGDQEKSIMWSPETRLLDGGRIER